MKDSASIFVFSAGCHQKISSVHFVTLSKFNKARNQAHRHAAFRHLCSFSVFFENKFLKNLNHIMAAQPRASIDQAFCQACLFLGSCSLFQPKYSTISANQFQILPLNALGRHTILLFLQYASYLAGSL
ncbi:hypothetical protein II582_04725 [bacterium]|nr:hypothetical protein [bacterium]